MRIKFLLAALLIVILLRFLTLGCLSLVDPTEGRYATIAQQMYLANDWITPRTFKKGELVPFLAKPPLQTWMTASAYTLLGMTEFASRLPSFLAAVMTLGITVYFGSVFFSLEVGLLAGLLLASSTLFFFIAGICMTDMFLVLSTCVAGSSYLQFSKTSGSRKIAWGRLFFIALGIGILAKGPLAPALVVVSLLPWLYGTRNFSGLRDLPWISGTAALVLLTVPWYLAVEYYNPGFIRYFVINENLLRFLTGHYGDRYGSAHIHPYGIIWLMLLGAFFPWSLLWIATFFKRKALSLPTIFSDHLSLFCLSWGLAPLVFFTFTRQISFYYVLPSLPWFSLLSAILMKRLIDVSPSWLMRLLKGNFFLSLLGGFVGAVIGYITGSPLYLAFLMMFILVGVLHLWRTLGRMDKHSAIYAGSPASTAILFSILIVTMSHFVNAQFSTRELVEYLKKDVPPPVLFGFVGKIPHSAFFYSREKAGHQLVFEPLPRNEKPRTEFHYVITKNQDVQKALLHSLSEFSVKAVNGGWTLLERR